MSNAGQRQLFPGWMPPKCSASQSCGRALGVVIAGIGWSVLALAAGTRPVDLARCTNLASLPFLASPAAWTNGFVKTTRSRDAQHGTFLETPFLPMDGVILLWSTLTRPNVSDGCRRVNLNINGSSDRPPARPASRFGRAHQKHDHAFPTRRSSCMVDSVLLLCTVYRLHSTM